MTFSFLLRAVAAILFILAAGGVVSPRFNLVAAGLALWVISTLVPGN